MTKIWNLAKKCEIHIPERAVEWNTKHKDLTKQILNSSKTNHTIAKKKEQNVKILYVCISSFSYTYQRKANKK